MMAPRRWKRGISLLVPAQEESQLTFRGIQLPGMTRRTVHLPQLGDDLVADNSLGHHDGEELFERSELGQSGVPSQPAHSDGDGSAQIARTWGG